MRKISERAGVESILLSLTFLIVRYIAHYSSRPAPSLPITLTSDTAIREHANFVKTGGGFWVCVLLGVQPKHRVMLCNGYAAARLASCPSLHLENLLVESD